MPTSTPLALPQVHHHWFSFIKINKGLWVGKNSVNTVEQCCIFVKFKFLNGALCCMDTDSNCQASWPHLTLLLGGNALPFAKADNDEELPAGTDLVSLIFALTAISPYLLWLYYQWRLVKEMVKKGWRTLLASKFSNALIAGNEKHVEKTRGETKWQQRRGGDRGLQGWMQVHIRGGVKNDVA